MTAKRIHELQRMVASEMDSLGVKDYELTRGGKHLKLIMHKGGNTRKVFMPGTPSCQRALLNCVGDMRRAARELEELSH